MNKTKSRQKSPKTQLVTIVKSQNYKWAILAVIFLVLGIPLYFYLFPREVPSHSPYFSTPISVSSLPKSNPSTHPKDLPPELQKTHTFKPLANDNIDAPRIIQHAQGWYLAQDDSISQVVGATPQGGNIAVRPITERLPVAPDVVHLHEHVLRSFPHDASCFTQGYAFYGGELFESCGLYGKSTLRHVNYETGKPTQKQAMPSSHFGEGLIIHYDPPAGLPGGGSPESYVLPSRQELLEHGKVFVLTWRERVIHAYNAATLEPLLPPHEPRREIPTEGWGIIIDPLYNQFIISDGSSKLYWYDMNTMKQVRQLTVTRYDPVRGVYTPQKQLNELEWIGGRIWANIWYSDDIVVIHPDNGQIERVLDASQVHTNRKRGEDVLNGIAFGKTKHNGGETKLLLTGKLWTTTYELDWRALVPVYETKSTTQPEYHQEHAIIDGHDDSGSRNNNDPTPTPLTNPSIAVIPSDENGDHDNDTPDEPQEPTLTWDDMELWVRERLFGQAW